MGGLIMSSVEPLLHTYERSGLEQPPVDARLDGDELVAFLDVPGLAEPPTIYVRGDRLVVEGLRTVGAGDAPARRRSRSRCRPFVREITLPSTADPDRLQLDYVGGVLRINVPPRALPPGT